MKPIRFGICGCGGISHLHAECLKALEAEGLARLVAGAEPNDGRRAAWSTKWNVPVYASLAEMLQSTDLDAVTITSPSGLHGEHVIEVARAGKHVLCEKPLDVKLDRADAAIAAAEKAGVILGGIYQQRFAPGPEKVKRAIDGGYFGRIVQVHCETPWYRTQGYYNQDAWRGTWALDGGVLGNQSPHMIDRLLWLAGDVDEVLHAELRCGLHRTIEAETVAAAIVRFTSGAIGTITGTTLAYDGMPQRVLICGTEGSCAFVGDELSYFKTSRPFEDASAAASAPVRGADAGAGNALSIGAQGHVANIRDFAMALRDQRPPRVVGRDARRFTKLLNQIYAKAGISGFTA